MRAFIFGFIFSSSPVFVSGIRSPATGPRVFRRIIANFAEALFQTRKKRHTWQGRQGQKRHTPAKTAATTV
jgi:hypothetical protein